MHKAGKHLVIWYPSMVIGGAEFLILRIAKHLDENGIAVDVVCASISVNMANEFSRLGLSVKVLSDEGLDGLPGYVERCLNDQGREKTFVSILTFFWENYYELSRYRFSRTVKTLMYVVGPRNLIDIQVNPYFKNHEWLNRQITARVIAREINSGGLCFMDGECFASFYSYYRLKPKRNLEDVLVRLPMVVNDKMPKRLVSESEVCPFTLLTVARADFPMKEYLLGSIDLFEECHRENASIKMVIVSYGKDFKSIEERIRALPEEPRKNITLIEGLARDELDIQYDEADLYIGMGTTILDSANRYLPAIAVKPYSRQVKVNGLYADFPDKITATDEDAYINAHDLVMSVVNMTPHEYKMLCQDSHKKFYELYSIDKNVGLLLQHLFTE